MNNLRHWDALSKTDPKHTKPFQRAGGFRGTATRPIWTEKRLTEHFGPCGVGWGFAEPEFTLVTAGDEILVFCTLRCWYFDASASNGDRETEAVLYGVGGDKVLTKRQDGRMIADDEAYKKAFTDALGNAFKHIGSNADIHMGLFEDSKYVRAMEREFAEAAPEAIPSPPASGRNAAPPSSARPEPLPAPAGSTTARGMLPVNPEEPPEVGEARADCARLIRMFRAAITEEEINHPQRGIWAKNKETILKIRKYGGEAAIDKLNEEAQKRLDELRITFLPAEAS